MNTFCWFLKLNIFRIFFIFYAEVKADLRSELLNGYSRFALPPDAPITVTVDLDFYQLIDFDVAAESVYGLFWQTNTWNDQRLAWQKNNTEQGSTEHVRFAYKEIWMPDVVTYNDIGVYDTWKYKNFIFLKSMSNGSIIWSHPAPMKTTCNMDVTHFPFDSHECQIIIASWQYAKNEVKFECNRQYVGLERYGGSMQWEIIETSCEKIEGSLHRGVYSGLSYKIHYKRLETFYTRILLWPNVCLLSLSSLMFFLPSGSSDRQNFGMTVLLTLSVNMMIITDFIPETSRNFPRICNYFLASFFLCVVGVLLVCIVDRADSSIKSHESTKMGEAPNLECEENNLTTGCRIRESSSRGEAPKRIEQIYLHFQKMVQRNETLVGFAYFMSTIVAHSWAYFGAYFY